METTKVLIFTGAGIGVPLNLPTSTGFITQVKADAALVTKAVMRYLSDPLADDIELILSTLEAFTTEVAFTEHVLPELMPGSAHSPSELKVIQRHIQDYKGQAHRELSRIKRLIFERLGSFEPKAATDLYSNLLAELKNRHNNAAFSIVTTNYDLTVEAAIEEQTVWKPLGISSFDFGFTERLGRPIYDSTREFKWDTATLELMKVHGSLDWHRDMRGQWGRSGSSTVPNDPDQMAILYPGFKGIPSAEPFRSLHRKLARRLSEASVIYVIGFAFRDAYINSLFDNILSSRKHLEVFYFNPLTLEEHPTESVARRFAAEHSGFQHFARGIQLTNAPLALASHDREPAHLARAADVIAANSQQGISSKVPPAVSTPDS